MYRAILAGFLLLFIGCKPKARMPVNDSLFESGIPQGELTNTELLEVSGLVESFNNPGHLWVHNDSGDKARIFLLDKQGNHKATVWLANTTNRDWEDIAIGPGPDEGKVYVYVGDIGDNEHKHKKKYIYRIEEPALDLKDPVDTVIHHVDKITFQLPDGPQDVELLMLDPHTRDLYLTSKRKKKVSLYRLPYPHSSTETMQAEVAISEKDFLQYEGESISKQGDELLINDYNALYYYQIVGGDISRDGNEVVIKSYSSVYYWKKKGSESIIELLQQDPVRLPYQPEPQGEAIAFDCCGTGYFTLSEKRGGTTPQLNFYKRK